MPFKKGHKHNENWYRAVSRPRPKKVKDAISLAQKGRVHTPQEGFQKGHKPIDGTEKTRFYKGQTSWNKGTGVGTDPTKIKLSVYKSNAKKRGLLFEVSLEQMRLFVSGKCYYCGSQSSGIDRVDNSLGYVEGNMVGCCGVCNHMKHTMSKEEFIKKCLQIVQAVGYEV